MSSLELQTQDYGRFSWQKDFLVLGIWSIWLILFVSFELPHWVGIHGLPLLILYGATRWRLGQAALILLFVSALFSSFSIMPSGLLWSALFFCLLVSRIIQMRFEINSALQFAAMACLISILLDLGVFFLMNFSANSELNLDWRVFLFVLSSALFHGILGLVVFPGFKRLTRSK